jgi:hypothetical protein
MVRTTYLHGLLPKESDTDGPLDDDKDWPGGEFR